MDKKTRWFITILIIVAILIVGIALVNIGNKKSPKSVNNQVTTNNVSSSTNVPSSVNQEKNVNNNYPEKMLEGKILSIKRNPLSFTIAAELNKIFSDEGVATKTIMTTKDTAFVLHNLDTGNESNLDISTLKPGDNILIWIEGSNRQAKSISTFIATKIMRFVGGTPKE